MLYDGAVQLCNGVVTPEPVGYAVTDGYRRGFCRPAGRPARMYVWCTRYVTYALRCDRFYVLYVLYFFPPISDPEFSSLPVTTRRHHLQHAPFSPRCRAHAEE